MATISELINWIWTWQQSFNAAFSPTISNPTIANNKSVYDTYIDALNRTNTSLNSIQKDVLGNYAAYEDTFLPYINQYFNNSQRILNETVPQINSNIAQVRSLYAPGWEQSNNIQSLYDNLRKSAQYNLAMNQNLAENSALRSGASNNAVAAARATAQANALDSLNKLESQRVSDLSNLYNNFFNLESQLRNERVNTQTNFDLNPLLNLAQQRQSIGNALVQTLPSLIAQWSSNAWAQQTADDYYRMLLSQWANNNQYWNINDYVFELVNASWQWPVSQSNWLRNLQSFYEILSWA